MPDTDTINIVKEAFCQWEVMDGIQDIRFAYPVIADNTVDLWRELQIGLIVVLEISEWKFFKVHSEVCGSGFEVWGMNMTNYLAKL